MSLKPKRYLRITEANEEYNLKESLLRKLIFQGKIETIRPAGTRVVLIPREALDRMMSEGRR
jgi:excisionase family DNA binding protein